ncbi:MAG: M48 family metallopeptidase [Chlorobium sp.]|nr:MAG: M48 family metallopeptidase [Chlorobium sp.]
MNIFGAVIFFTLIITFLVRLVSELLNLRAAAAGLPEEFARLFDKDACKKSRDYLGATTTLSLFSAAIDLLILLLFWFTGSFNLLDQFLRGYGFNPVVTGVLYIGTLLLLQSLVALPFSACETFIIEEKFGFNKTTPSVFVLDIFKALLLAVLLGTPLLAGVLWFFEVAGSMAWLWAWGGMMLFSLLLQYVAPTLIMPLFNKFVPLGAGELKSDIMRYASRVKFPLSDIYVLDGSKRSEKANAFFTGFGKYKRIALFDTLIASHTVHELVAVLAHEIGHFMKKHIVVTMFLSLGHLGVIFFLLSLFMNNRSLFDAFLMTDTSVYGSLIFFMLLYTPIEWILSVVMNALSRKHEYEADAYAVSTYEHGQALGDALKKLARNNLSNLTPHPLYVFLNYSHPPVLQRIKRIKALAAGRAKS